MAQTQPQGQADHAGGDGHQDKNFWALVLGSIGVVFGDIGTSPLYAFREAIHAAKSRGLSTGESALGVLSLILWVLILIVTLKYVLILLRADNKGEGGTFALMALGQSVAKRSAPLLLALGIAGAVVLLRRCRHHAGDLGAVGGRRLEADRAAARAARSYRLSLVIIAAALLDAVARHRPGGRILRPDHRRLVRRCWRIGGLMHIVDNPNVSAGAQSALRHHVRRAPRRHRPHDHGPRVPGRDRRRGALRRSRPFRPQADPGRHGSGSCCRRCCSTISARARWC